MSDVTRIVELKAALAAMEAVKDAAYWERNQLVTVLSKLRPSHLCRHADDDTAWDDDWRWIVCVHLPNGDQVTWHIHDREYPQFAHLQVAANHWDGHDTAEKYRRLMAVQALSL